MSASPGFDLFVLNRLRNRSFVASGDLKIQHAVGVMCRRVLSAFTLAAVVAACTSIPAARPAPVPLQCNSKLELPEAVTRARIVLVGESHGTNEMPRAFVDIACHFLKERGAVSIGVEMPQADQALIDTYLASSGKPDDRRALLRSPHWSRPIPQQDGRASDAMLQVIDWVRVQRQAGRAAHLFAFDDETRAGDSRSRDERMAANVVAVVTTRVARLPHEATVLLGGVSRMAKQTPAGRNQRPMGSYLADGELFAHGVVALLLADRGGTAWQVRNGHAAVYEFGKCHQPAVGAVYRATDPAFVRAFAHVMDGFDGFIDVGCITVSVPAASIATK